MRPYSLAMPLERCTTAHALVTGAASGIGRATALRLARRGPRWWPWMSTPSCWTSWPPRSTASRVAHHPGRERRVRRGGRAPGGRRPWTGWARSTSWSTWPGCSRSPTPTSRPWTEWNRLIAINLTGTFLVCRQALPHLLARGGNIVNLASTAAHKGQPWAAAYAASKGGVLAFTRALAVEYAGAGLRVNSISPGAIDTPITPAFQLPEGADIKLLNRVTPHRRLRDPRGDRRGHRLRGLGRGVPHERGRHPDRRRHPGLIGDAERRQPSVDRPSVAHQSAVILSPAIEARGISSS